MKILINASNLKKGGGLQVADSVCRELYKYPQHEFVVVFSSCFDNTKEIIEGYKNVSVYTYNIKNSISTFLFGRDDYLDGLIKDNNIDAALTIFGPSRWIPKVPHLSGFAQGHLVLPDSPYWNMLKFKQRLRMKTKLFMIQRSLDKCANYYFTENPLITERLKKLYPQKQIYTVTNNVNQVFYHPEQWDRSIKLPEYDGLALLTVAANYPHKNLSIIVPATKWLVDNHPDLHFRFILTIREEDMPELDPVVREHIVFLGKVNIAQVPYLYEQSDFMLLPTLLECFSASYAEAMVMQKPILTTDLVFARGLCEDAALYFKATSPIELGKAIVRLSKDEILRKKLVAAGKKRIMNFDTPAQRAEKLIKIVESIA